jgi:hypothetical protein
MIFETLQQAQQAQDAEELMVGCLTTKLRRHRFTSKKY